MIWYRIFKKKIKATVKKTVFDHINKTLIK